MKRQCGAFGLVGATSVACMILFLWALGCLAEGEKKFYSWEMESVSESSQQKRKLVTHGLEDQKRVSGATQRCLCSWSWKPLSRECIQVMVGRWLSVIVIVISGFLDFIVILDKD